MSKPNLFILQNRWDISAFEDDVDEVKQQHLDRNLQFLCDELTLMERKEGLERVFFVSSREALAARLKESGTPTPSKLYTAVKQSLKRVVVNAFIQKQFLNWFLSLIEKGSI